MSSTDHAFVFIGGLHRSGTSLFAKCLADHPAIAGFHDTGVPEDEGQHLQTVYRKASAYGGPGKFGFAPAMHLTESSPLITDANRAKLWSEWSRYWDLTHTHLVEKSPPNLIKARFLQAMFPNSCFIFLLRHPVAVAGATKKWKKRTPLDKLVEHWTVCHEILRDDLPHLQRAMVLHYEDFVRQPSRVLEETFRFAGLVPVEAKREIRRTVNDSYFERWEAWRKEFFAGRSIRRAERLYESRLNELGYSVVEPRSERRSPWSRVSD